MAFQSERGGADPCDRRAFLERGLSCAAWLGLSAAIAPTAARRVFASAGSSGRLGPSTESYPWGRLEELGEGIWALVSTPLSGGPEARKTLCNGGIIAGRDGVLVVEAFATAEGARWMAEQARRLTGNYVTHVVITHHHGDHANGRGGYATLGHPPRIMTTPVTRDRLAEKMEEAASDRRPPPPEGSIPAEGDPLAIDLGGRTVRVVPRRGHTASDLTVRVEEPPVLFCGDLVWNGLFPNYMDARPSQLHGHVRDLVAAEYPVYVPGHGPLADGPALRRYWRLLQDIQDAARQAREQGVPPEEAAARYRPPESLGDWTLFSDRYYELAFEAWRAELGERG